MNYLENIAQSLHHFANVNDDSKIVTPYFYQEISAFISEGLKNPDLKSEELDCKTGCTACCHLPVKTPPELIFFIAHCLTQSLNDEHLTELKALLQTYTDQWHSTPEDMRLLTRLKCPFLDPDNACLIYEIRPFSCRAFTSTDVRVCNHVFEHPEDQTTEVEQNSFIYAVFQLATTILSSVAKSRDRDPEQVYFIPSLLIALENSDLEDQWKNGEKLPYT